MDMVQDLVMWGLGILATGLLTISTTYIKRLEARTSENFIKIAANFDKLSDIVASHDRQLASLKTADVEVRLNDHSKTLVEIQGEMRYQGMTAQQLYKAVQELRKEVNEERKEITKDLNQIAGTVETLTQNCAAHLQRLTKLQQG